MSFNNYKNKYLKYKQKYLALQQQADSKYTNDYSDNEINDELEGGSKSENINFEKYSLKKIMLMMHQSDIIFKDLSPDEKKKI